MPYEYDEDPKDGSRRHTFWFYISPDQVLWGLVFIAALIMIFTI
jgi:hypothetical protein